MLLFGSAVHPALRWLVRDRVEWKPLPHLLQLYSLSLRSVMLYERLAPVKEGLFGALFLNHDMVDEKWRRASGLMSLAFCRQNCNNIFKYDVEGTALCRN